MRRLDPNVSVQSFSMSIFENAPGIVWSRFVCSSSSSAVVVAGDAPGVADGGFDLSSTILRLRGAGSGGILGPGIPWIRSLRLAGSSSARCFVCRPPGGYVCDDDVGVVDLVGLALDFPL